MNTARHLREELKRKFSDMLQMEVGAGKQVVITIIDDKFETVKPDERHQQVASIVEAAGFIPAIIEVFTVKEARDAGVIFHISQQSPATWADAITIIDDGEDFPPVNRTNFFKRVVFYSYKGGVGRTTALIHTGFHLARQGKRVVLVDMDVEAPGLHRLLPRNDGLATEYGLVDYLWERQVKPDVQGGGSDLQTALVNTGVTEVVGIAYAVEDPISRAQVYVIPAGSATRDYVQRLSTLSYRDVLSRSDDAWSQFERELKEQLDPEIVLIDARTGLGEWGGLSLLRLADEACLVMFPSEQNVEGVSFVRSLLADFGAVPSTLIFSPVPEGAVGQELAARVIPMLGLADDDIPVEIFYSQGVAGAVALPVESAMPAYARLAARITESQTEAKVEASLSKADRRTLLESLRFPQRDAKSIGSLDFEMFFQKTTDFDKVLDDARWVIRGRKGTGKSTLFHLFIEHQNSARSRARGKLDGIDVMPGHGPAEGAEFRPTTDEFAVIQKMLSERNSDWLSFWRVYLIVRLWVSQYAEFLEVLHDRNDLLTLKKFLASAFPLESCENWRFVHSESCVEIASGTMNSVVRDAMSDMNRLLGGRSKKLWILYDDLDQDIREESSWQGEALGGLLRLAYDSNNQNQHNVRFKVFLREDIWAKLVFTNKSHFGEPRTVLLQWRSEDFLRLAYRLAVNGSPVYRNLAQRELAIADDGIDSASEDNLQRALAPLWGYSQERGKKALAAKWVYSRMTDSRDNTYPRSLTVLLNSARDEELENPPKSPPSDRLLSPRSMQAGLKAASEERVNALKNEYASLVPFLEDVQQHSSLRSQFSGADLNGVWRRTSSQPFPTFESFVSELELSGLLMRKKGSTYDYGFSSLYIDGLGVMRVQGEKK